MRGQRPRVTLDSINDHWAKANVSFWREENYGEQGGAPDAVAQTILAQTILAQTIVTQTIGSNVVVVVVVVVVTPW